MRGGPKISRVELVDGVVHISVEWGSLVYHYKMDIFSSGMDIVSVENDDEPLFFTVVTRDGYRKTIAMFLPDEEPYIDFYDFEDILHVSGRSVNFTMMYK